MPSTILTQSAAGGLLVLAFLVGDSQAVQLTPQNRLGVRQTIEFNYELGGSLIISPATEDKQQQTIPIEVKAKLEYDEQLQRGDYPRSVRYYRKAEATANVGGKARALAITNKNRPMVADLKVGSRRLLGINGPLDREAVELVDLPADSLAIDMLLPGDDVEPGGTWQADMGTIQALTGIDRIGICEVTNVLSEANKEFARCQIAGTVQGVAHGAEVVLELDGIYLVDLERGQISNFNLAIRQNREAGPAKPGLDVVAKLKLKRSKASSKSPLSNQLIAKAKKLSDDSMELMRTSNDRLGISMLLDTKWYVMGQLGEQMSLRRVEAEGLITHANITKLNPQPLDISTALARFRSDVMRSLGEDAVSVAAEQQWTNKHGCRVMSVTVVGNVSDVPVEWHCYQVAPASEQENLHRLALTFTVEKDSLEQLDGADRELVDHIQLVPTRNQQAAKQRKRK